MTFKRVWSVTSLYQGKGRGLTLDYSSLEAALGDVEYISRSEHVTASMISRAVPA